VSTFAVEVTLIHPEHREHSMTAELLVDTGAFYSLLPAEIVERLELSTEADFEGVLASGEPVLYRQGEVRVRIGGRERTTVFVAGPRGCLPLLGAFTLEAFALAADARNQRLVPIRPLGHV
jgi:aspartyl protease family protein